MAIKSKHLSRTESQIDSPESGVTVDDSPVELGFVIDKSSSMQYLKTGLIESFNRLLAEQSAPNVKASLNLFSDEVAIVADNLPVQILAKLNNRSYSPEGQTALLDGIGSMIFLIDRVNATSRKLVAIFTDGHENASRNFDLEQIQYMIREKQEAGWQFIFITPARGIEYALELGIPREHIVDWDNTNEGVKAIMGKLSKTVKAYRIGDADYAQFLLGA